MPPSGRLGSATSKTGASILEAAEQIMIEDGYSAVTSRRVAERAGIHAGNVHYYFPTMDDLFIALLDRGADKSSERLAAALASPQPLNTLWQAATQRRGVALLDELMAAARHRPALRERVGALAQAARKTQVDALRDLAPDYGLDDALFPPELLAAAIQSTALLVLREESFGIDTGHAVADAVGVLIEHLEDRRARARRDDHDGKL